MKKLVQISFLIVVLCFAVPVYADGDMPTGSRTCTENCPALSNGSTTTETDEASSEDSTVSDIYSWIYNQLSDLIG